jgi:phage shock protein PspC (stress-responsive transcriptional regulator)
MPSLIRLIVVLAVLAGLVFAGMFALATFVQPQQSEMTIRVPAEKLNPKTPDNGG